MLKVLDGPTAGRGSELPGWRDGFFDETLIRETMKPLSVFLLTVTSGAAFAQTTGAVDPSPAPAEPSVKEDVPPGGCMPIGLTASGEIVFPIQCKEFIQRQRGEAVEQKPNAGEERPGVSLPAWANSDALVKSAPPAKQPDVAPEDSKPVTQPVEPVPLAGREPREPAMGPDHSYPCQRYRTYDPASATYTGYDGRRHSCP
jgi:hypothetical protein